MKLKQGKLPGKPACPGCGAVLNAYSDVQQTGQAPRPGDYVLPLLRIALGVDWLHYQRLRRMRWSWRG
jgi:hypothetical protein